MSTPIPITFRGGRHAPDPTKAALNNGAIKQENLPAPPAASDSVSAVPGTAWGMLGNDTVGDCTCAGVGHKRVGDVYINQDTVLPVTTAETLSLCGFEVPNTAMDQFNEGKPWDVVKGSSIEGGHCVTVGAYDKDGLTCVTWGALQKMTWRFFETYFDEAWVVIGADDIDSTTGLDHLGVSLAALETEFAALTGTRLGGH